MYLLQLIDEDNQLLESVYKVTFEEVTQFIGEMHKKDPSIFVRIYVELPQEI